MNGSILFVVVSVLREELPSMGCDRNEKPSVVSCPAIKSDNGSEPWICLNPSTIADVCEHVDATGRNRKIAAGQISVILAVIDSGLPGCCLRGSGSAPAPRNRLEARFP